MHYEGLGGMGEGELKRIVGQVRLDLGEERENEKDRQEHISKEKDEKGREEEKGTIIEFYNRCYLTFLHKHFRYIDQEYALCEVGSSMG